MPNKKALQALFIKVSAISFFVTLLIAAPYISRRAPGLLKSLTESNKAGRLTEKLAGNTSSGSDESLLEGLMAPKKAAVNQVKPGLGNLPVEFFSANKAFALDFHKIPADYLTPQAPEVTRTAVSRLKEFKAADLKAIAAQQALLKGTK